MPETMSTPEIVDWDDLPGLDGQPLDGEKLAGKAVLVVNVTSKCGLTPQYEGLERLQRTYGDRGFTVLGIPCNQSPVRNPERRTRSKASAEPPTRRQVTTTVEATDVRIGDRLRTRTGLELTVTRIEHGLLGRENFISFVEDSDEQWLKLPAPRDGEVELVSRGTQ
jgi:hypothetical protein